MKVNTVFICYDTDKFKNRLIEVNRQQGYFCYELKNKKTGQVGIYIDLYSFPTWESPTAVFKPIKNGIYLFI